MDAAQVEKLINDDTHKVVMFYGGVDFTPGGNFLFAVMPKTGQGAQWHRDIIPALKRYLKRFDRPFAELVTGTDGQDPKEAISSLDFRRAGKSRWLWLAFEWEDGPGGKQRGAFREVDFDAVLTLPELMNELSRLASKDVLTEDDKARLAKLNGTMKLYREHPLGEMMRAWHDLGCEWDSMARHLEHGGSRAEAERSRADAYHAKAEEVRQRIEANHGCGGVSRYRLIAQVNNWAKDEFECETTEAVEGLIAADKARLDENHPDLVADLGCIYVVIEQHVVRVETHGKTWEV